MKRDHVNFNGSNRLKSSCENCSKKNLNLLQVHKVQVLIVECLEELKFITFQFPRLRRFLFTSVDVLPA